MVEVMNAPEVNQALTTPPDVYAQRIALATAAGKGSAPGRGAAPWRPERRGQQRLQEAFEATVTGRGPAGGPPLRVAVWDVDQEGARLRTSRPLATGKAIMLRFRLPKSVSDFYRGLACELPARVRDVRACEAGGKPAYDIILRWERPFTESVTRAIGRYQRKVGAVILAIILGAVWLKWRGLRFFWYDPLFVTYSSSLLAYLMSRFYIAWKHQVPRIGSYTPTVSVVISVRNEEKAIAKTVEACLKTDYPPGQREVIVVNDGSTDGTARVLAELAAKYPDLRTYSISPSGKRYGMAEGVKRSSGEIIVFVDSDTFLRPLALRHIVCGFEDPELGAASGYTDVENSDINTLTGLQEVRYYVSFRLLKSAESYFGCVTCCPGCLSAYRRAYLLEVLEPWLTQRFLGAPATFGDDRSLTNFILRKYRVIYNDLATASTLVPETWRQYMTQQVRWKKSWLRETWIAARFMWRKHPAAAISFYAAAVFSLLSPIMLVRVIYLGMHGGHGSIMMYYFLGLVAVGLLQSLYFLYRRPSPHWVLGMLWMASSLFLTGPQTYYAILTMHKNHWGTR